MILLTSIRGHQSLVRSYLLFVDASPVDTTTLEYRVCISVIKVVDGVTCSSHTLVYISRERLPMCCCKSALRKGYLSLRPDPIAEPNATHLPAPRVT